MAETFSVPPASSAALLRLGIVSSLGFTAAAASIFMIMTAPPGTQIWGLAGAGLFGAGLGIVVLWALYCAQAAHLRVDTDGVHLEKAALFGRSFTWEELQIDRATIAPVSESSEFGPAQRRSGLEMTGLTVGRFGLKNGREGLLFLTSREKVLILPTNAELDLVVSVEAGARVLETLRSTR